MSNTKKKHSGENATVVYGSRWSGTDFKGLITLDPSVHQRESVCVSLSKPEGEMDRQWPHVVVFWNG